MAKTRLRKCFLIKCLRARGLDIIQLLYQIKMPSWPLKYKGRRFPSSITEQSRPAPLPPPPQHEESSAAAAHRPTVLPTIPLCCPLSHCACWRGIEPCHFDFPSALHQRERPLSIPRHNPCGSAGNTLLRCRFGCDKCNAFFRVLFV